MVFRVFKENSFGAATVEIGKDQKAISTGPYAVLRGGVFHRHVFGPRLLLGAHPCRPHNSWSGPAAVRRGTIPCRESAWLSRILRESPLSSHTRRVLRRDDLKLDHRLARHCEERQGRSVYARRASFAGQEPAEALCLSKIKSEHIRGAIRRGLGGKECALPSSRCAIGARPYSRPSACASHYSSERKISESGADEHRPGQ
jgi:hypothetical protein